MPLFKLVDSSTARSVFVVQAKNIHEADKRIPLIFSLYATAAWLRDVSDFDVYEHPAAEPLQVPSFLDGYFAVLSEAYAGNSTH